MKFTVVFLFIGLALGLAVPVSAAPDGHDSSQATADIHDVLTGLQGLNFDEFVDASYIQVLLRSPEIVTGMGLSESLGTGDGRLDNICYSFVDETYQLKAGILAILGTYERSNLVYEQRITYDSYSWLLSDWADEFEFMYHFYPVNHGISRQNDLIRLFEDGHPMETAQNAEDYVSRLEQVDDQFACLIQNLNDSESRGIVAPAQMLQQAADQIRDIAEGTARSLPFFTTFSTKVASIAELNASERHALRAEVEHAINTSVIPAYQALVARLDEQIPHAPPMNGVWQLPDGDRFYASRVSHHTTTDLTIAEIHQMGLDEIPRVQGQIRDACDLLGYPRGETLAELYDRIAWDSGIIPADEIVSLNEGYIRQAQEDIKQVFDIEPASEVIVIGGAQGGFYLPGSLDESRPGAYYVIDLYDTPRYWMRTIAYHEAVPGHHFQISIGDEQDVPLFLKGGEYIYTAFVEGWALYAEYLAMELGWYDDDIYSELGRLQWDLLRAARLVVETGLHHYRWSRQEAIDYFIDEVGSGPASATHQIDQYLFLPGYFTTYKVGFWKIMELRQYAMDELGEDFDIKEFHRAVLLHNRLPLPLLERLIDDYISRVKARYTPRQTTGRRSPLP